MIKRILAIWTLAALMAGCGSGAGGERIDDGTNPPPTGPVAASITLTTSSPQIASDGSAPADITAFVKGSNNQFLADVPVTFSASSGGLAVARATTDQSGTALASVEPAGDPTNRVITITATAGTLTATVDVAVTGTQLTLSGPSNLPQGGTGTYSVSLRDAGGTGIAGQSIAVSSARSNTLSSTSVTTDSSGQATFTMTAANGGTDTVTATGMGLSATQSTEVSLDQFSFTAPNQGAEIVLNTPQSVTVQWQQGGVPQVGRTVNFSTTRGQVTPSSAVTNGSGIVTFSVQANNAGPAILSAVGVGGPTVTRAVEFVSTTPALIDVQANPFTIAPQGQSILTAVVRDAEGNLVKNRVVSFSLQDVTGGQLSAAQATTDSQGRVQTTYTASNSTSAAGGVQVTATVQGTAISDTVAITVAQRELFISLGTGNEIEEPTPATYRKVYEVRVTDARGVGVANATVTMELLSTIYSKGTSSFVGGRWIRVPSETCEDEDEDHDGILDVNDPTNPDNDEDDNNSGRIEAGNIASVSPRQVTTDANGFALVNVEYAQEYAYWVAVKLTASTSVQGTEFGRSVMFNLPGLASDFNNQTVDPPGPDSPFNGVGDMGTCDTP